MMPLRHLCVLLVVSIHICLAASTAISEPPQGWILDPNVSDEFDGSALNETKWHPTNPTWLGRLPGLFAPHNVKLQDGTLQMWARHENITDPNLKKQGYANYTTSAVQSTATTMYGYYEIRARPGSSLVSSSFWFYHQRHNAGGATDWWTEIDVFEACGSEGPNFSNKLNMHTHVFDIPGVNSSSLPHVCNCTLGSQELCDQQLTGSGSDGTTQRKSPAHGFGDSPSCTRAAYYTAPFNLSDDFHVYSLLWTESNLVYSLDGQVRWNKTNNCMHQPLTINFDRETMPDWFGLPPFSSLPDVPFTIDYIRVYKPKQDS